MEEKENMDNELFSPEEMQSPFDAIKETDAEGREWWNSRKLARLMDLTESGEVHLSEAIRKIKIPSEKRDEQGVLMYNLDAIIAVGYPTSVSL